ncbi:acriflavine resistance protein B [Saccharobesus litoralis]|uniref:Acriflavine resistance protein B n=1 Tax=Saccharobesus litoralis TaxID=2172099 RepID=A0A2S0VR27_9ALTE|nr:efflux RND transporter permease subunit [Saccharobesus litoralis]AWB66649.1 acriflavine resistance protein B [Saccharobesus litoralis]
MIAWFAKNDIASNLLMIALLLAGAWSLAFNLPQQVFPNLEPAQVEVKINYPAVSAQDVEFKVTRHIEQAIKDIVGVKSIASESRKGGVQIYAILHKGYDPHDILSKVKHRIDAINTLPKDIDKPLVQIRNEFAPVISMVVYGEQTPLMLLTAAEQIRDELASQNNMNMLVLRNVAEHEIAIEVSNENLQRYQISLQDIAQAIQRNAQDISAGNIHAAGGLITIRSRGQAYTAQQLADVVVKFQANGSTIKLRQVANIRDAVADSQVQTRFNGLPAVFVDVMQNDQQKATQLSRMVKRFVAAKQSQMPESVQLAYWRDHAEILQNRLEGLAVSAIYGGILVFLILTLFLRPAVAFWVFIGVPVSFIGAFSIMPIFGVSINIVSVFGFILVLGMVVDDAIVTGENVYSHLEHSETGLHAAVSGTKEVAQPVTLGVLTSIVAFMPLFFVDGAQGVILSQIPAVVIPVLILSLIESKWVLPSRLKFVRLRPSTNPRSLLGWQQKFAERFEAGIGHYYKPALQWCVHNRFNCLIIFVGFLLVVLSGVFTGENKFVFFPKITADKVVATITMPSGTQFSTLDKYVQTISRHAETLQQRYIDEESGNSVIRNIVSVSGAKIGSEQQGQVGQVSFELLSEELHGVNINSLQLEQAWRDLVGSLPGVESLVFEAQSAQLHKFIDIRLRGDDLAELEIVADKIKTNFSKFSYIEDVAKNYESGSQELFLELTPLAKTLGLTRVALAEQVRAAFYGIEVQRLLRGEQLVKVMVRLPLDERKSLSDLERFLIHLPDNRLIPLSQLADFQIVNSPAVIFRVDRQRSIDITADLSNAKVGLHALNKQLNHYVANLQIQHPTIDISLVGESTELMKTLDSLKWSLLLVILIIYGILAISFKSYSQPFIVMSVIPFSIIGSMGGHWLMSLNLTMMSFVGLMALIGVVVNDAVVLVDFINNQLKRGASLHNAILQVTSTRFRPVVLTSLTTFLGLLPIVLDQSSQAQFLVPMAVSLGFGILLAPFITLILVPVNFMILQQVKQWSNQKCFYFGK